MPTSAVPRPIVSRANSTNRSQLAISKFVRYVGFSPYFSQSVWNLGRNREFSVVISVGLDQMLSPSVSIVMRKAGTAKA
jgi:hypothetical protein